MGDAGSNFFGLMLGILVLCSDFLSVWTWMILLCQFIVDACLTISIRALGRQSIHKSHSQHAYQHLNRKIGSLKTLLLTILINFIWLLPLAALAERFPNTGFGLLLLAALPILVKDWLAGAGRETPGIGISRLGARDKKIDDGKETI